MGNWTFFRLILLLLWSVKPCVSHKIVSVTLRWLLSRSVLEERQLLNFFYIIHTFFFYIGLKIFTQGPPSDNHYITILIHLWYIIGNMS